MSGSAQKTITLRTVLHEINQPGATFSLKLRKLDGSVSVKAQVMKNPTKAKEQKATGKKSLPAIFQEGVEKLTDFVKTVSGKKDLQSIRRDWTKEGALMLYDCVKKHPFEAKIELLVEFNGYRIFHNY